MAILNYYLHANQDPKILARKLKETMTVTVHSRHQRLHEEEVAEYTKFHLNSGRVMPLMEFVAEFC